MTYPRKHRIHSAWRWRTFPFFGWHVVRYPRGGGYTKVSWHLSKYKARCIARDKQRAEHNAFYRGK